MVLSEGGQLHVLSNEHHMQQDVGATEHPACTETVVRFFMFLVLADGLAKGPSKTGSKSLYGPHKMRGYKGRKWGRCLVQLPGNLEHGKALNWRCFFGFSPRTSYFWPVREISDGQSAPFQSFSSLECTWKNGPVSAQSTTVHLRE